MANIQSVTLRYSEIEDRLLALESEKLKLELRMLQIGGKLAHAAGRE